MEKLGLKQAPKEGWKGPSNNRRLSQVSVTVRIKAGKSSEKVTQWKNEKGNVITVVENDFRRAVGNKVRIVWNTVKFKLWISSINLSKLFWSQFTYLPNVTS